MFICIIQLYYTQPHTFRISNLANRQYSVLSLLSRVHLNVFHVLRLLIAVLVWHSFEQRRHDVELSISKFATTTMRLSCIVFPSMNMFSSSRGKIKRYSAEFSELVIMPRSWCKVLSDRIYLP